MLKKLGNSFFLIQHVRIRLEHISKHFYQIMPSQITFSGFPASLLGHIPSNHPRRIFPQNFAVLCHTSFVARVSFAIKSPYDREY